MTQNNMPYTTPSDREFAVERIFNAPRELVWKVWTKAEHLTNWFGPKGWALPVCEVDFRPGGTWSYCMRSPEGQESWGKATYQEIIEPERLVYTDAFADADGNLVEGMPEMRITVIFEDLGGKTKVTSVTQFPSAQDLEAILKMGVVEGLTETWDRLDAYLANL